MEQENHAYLGEEKVGKLMGRYAIPCIVSLLVGALYNIVDQIFIALVLIGKTYRELNGACYH